MAEVAESVRKGVVLVGHGAVPKDCPRELVTRLKALEMQRRRAGTDPTPEEVELDTRIRRWPRTPVNDPYRSGLESLAQQVRPLLNGARFTVAYNEFCAPTVEEAVAGLVAAGATEVLVVPTMMTPGGVHSEVEIPECLQRLRHQHPGVQIRYAWPFDLGLVARLLAQHLEQFE